ncbi:MAG: hypothetical protein ACTHWH_17565, partial [Marinobacter sp.]
MGEQNEPFLRFSPQGVEANRHSATWGMIVPAGAPSFVANTDDAEARWAQVSGGSNYGWIEPRAASANTVEDPTQPGVVKRWGWRKAAHQRPCNVATIRRPPALSLCS